MTWSDGSKVSNRIQPFDATFGLTRTSPISLHRAGGLTTSLPAQAAVRKFDDSNVNRYYDPANPQGSVKVAGSGTVIKVVRQADNGTMTIQVSFK